MNDEAREAKLAELFFLPPDDPRRVAALRADPALASRLAELEAASAELDSRFEVEREAALQEALEEEADPESEARLLAGLRARAAERPGAPPARRPALALLVTGLAAAAVLLLFLLPRGGDGDPREVWLRGPEAHPDARPSGTVEAERFGSFEWSPGPELGAVQRVRVWNGTELGGPPDFESPDLMRPSWTPGAEISGALASEIRWQVVEKSPVDGEWRRVLEVGARLSRSP